MIFTSRVRPCLCCVCFLLSGCSLFDDIALSEGSDLDEGIAMMPDMSGMSEEMSGTMPPDADSDRDASSSPPDIGDTVDMSEDLVDMEAQDMGEPVVPDGWWAPAWTRRHEVLVQEQWDGDIVLPVRLEAEMSAHDGEELVFLFEGSSTPLHYEVEAWTQGSQNVAWVRFPEGIRLGDKLHVYSHIDDLNSAPPLDTDRVWEGLARHVYHFDGRDDFIVHDRVSDAGVDLLKQGMITAAPPTQKMGKHLVLTEQTPNLRSGDGISAIHVGDGQATTIEAHYIVPSLPDHPGERRLISDEDRCHGLSHIFTNGLVLVRFVQGNGTCAPDTPESPVGTQTVSQRRYDPGDVLHVFTVIDWDVLTMTTTINGDDVTVETLKTYAGTRLTPVRLEIGGAPFTESQHPLLIDTLVVHDRALSSAESALIHRATHRNDTVFRIIETTEIAPQR